MKKIVSLLLCLALLMSVTLLSACGSKIQQYTEDEITAAAESAAATATTDTTTAAAAETVEDDPAPGCDTYDADFVVCTVDGSEVTWEEYYYWLNYNREYILAYLGTIEDWNSQYTEDMTFADVLLESASNGIAQYHTMQTWAAELGVTLSEEDEAAIVEYFETTADSYSGDGDGVCTEEEAAAFQEYLDTLFVSRELYDFITEVSLLQSDIYVEQFGADAEAITDEEVEAWIDEQGLLSAKHILLLTNDLTDEDEIAAVREQAEELYAQLAAVTDQEEMIALFDTLMAEYGEDPGMQSQPDGYVFLPAQMVTEFSDATAALDVNYGLSEVVESSYGYHIILRLPITRDSLVTDSSTGYSYTVASQVASERLTADFSARLDAAEIVWTEGLDQLDLNALFNS